jgi:predicted alpha/beta hydrolase family esterase
MTKPVLFLQGAGEGAYAEDALLAADLRERLGSAYSVVYPEMPDEGDADFESWKRTILEQLLSLGDGVIVVGHSVGGSVVAKLLVDGDLGRAPAGIFLVSAPFWHDHEFWNWKEAELPKDVHQHVPLSLPLFFYHGSADEVVPCSHLDLYEKAFPSAVVHRLIGRDHQLNNDLSEVARDIRSLS